VTRLRVRQRGTLLNFFSTSRISTEHEAKLPGARTRIVPSLALALRAQGGIVPGVITGFQLQIYNADPVATGLSFAKPRNSRPTMAGNSG